MRGSLQAHRQRKEKIFKKIPARLCFKLTSLVPPILLDEGYVFLGFTKDGQFIISYSLQVDTDENTGFLPVYVYNLQWWWFIPCKPLKKISEVRLFEDGIEPDIFIAVCEWPTDRSKILVYGHCVPRSREEGTQCFITITAVPPLSSCKDCYIAETNFPCVKHKNKVMCLKHSFCIYCKYELAPPFPSFIPQIQLKMDGVVVLNTGDSLVALDFRINQPTTTCGQTGSPADETKRLFSCGSTNPANNNLNGYYNFRGSPAGSDSATESDDEGWGGRMDTRPTSTPVTSTSSSSSCMTTTTTSSLTAISNGSSVGGSGSTTSLTSSVSRCCQRTKFHPVNPSNTDQIEPPPQQQYLCCSTCCSESSATACCRHSKATGHCRNCNCENSCPLSLNNGPTSGNGDEALGNLSLKQPCCTVCDKALTAASAPSCLHHHHHPHHHHHHNHPHHHHHHNHSHHHHVGTNFSPTPPPSSPTSCCDNNHANRLTDNNSRRCRAAVKQRNGCTGSSCCCCCCTCVVETAKTDQPSSLPSSLPPSAVFQHNTKLNVLEECRCPKRNNGTASPAVGSTHHSSKCFCTAVGDPDTKENMVESTSQQQQHLNNNNNGLSDPSFFSPSNSSSGSPTTNSNENLPDSLHPNKSRSMSFSLKKFTYLTEETNVDSIFRNEDEIDFDLAYRSILPLEVRGTDQKMMKATKSNTDSNQPDHITVCQLMLDIEHFLEEVIHNLAEWGHRYIAFLNYDLQLLDVNAESGEVLAKVFALVQARKELSERKDLKRSHRPKQYYQTSITFSWSLLTGNYETFHIEDLSAVDESDLLKKEWNPGNGEVTKLQQSLAIPQSSYNRVCTLTNEPVLKGHSLTTIVAPHHFVAISR